MAKKRKSQFKKRSRGASSKVAVVTSHSQSSSAGEPVCTLPPKFVEALDESVELLSDFRTADTSLASPAEALPSLLDQCRSLLSQLDCKSPPPIRTVHHLACTGGTLISKCLSAMANVQLLSEVDPLSEIYLSNSTSFCPSDLVKLTHLSSRGAHTELLEGIFLASLQYLYDEYRSLGLNLVLRDHSHSHFCTQANYRDRASLREVLRRRFDVVSIITVRDPLESYLSLVSNGWCHFQPSGIEEYAIRYLAFLEHYRDCHIFRYEDFVDNPDQILAEMCSRLQLSFNPEYKNIFSAFSLSGDSGRSGGVIKHRARKSIPESIKVQIQNSENWVKLCQKLGYLPASELQ